MASKHWKNFKAVDIQMLSALWSSPATTVNRFSFVFLAHSAFKASHSAYRVTSAIVELLEEMEPATQVAINVINYVSTDFPCPLQCCLLGGMEHKIWLVGNEMCLLGHLSLHNMYIPWYFAAHADCPWRLGRHKQKVAVLDFQYSQTCCLGEEANATVCCMWNCLVLFCLQQ